MENGGEDPRNDSETPRSEPVANPVAPPKEGEHPDGVHDASDAQTGRKAEKAEPINIVVRDQSGAGLQFKVRKNTKFEKVMTAFCQKKHVQTNQVRFLYDGERIRADQTPQSVGMEDGDIIDCVVEQMGGYA